MMRSLKVYFSKSGHLINKDPMYDRGNQSIGLNTCRECKKRLSLYTSVMMLTADLQITVASVFSLSLVNSDILYLRDSTFAEQTCAWQ